MENLNNYSKYFSSGGFMNFVKVYAGKFKFINDAVAMFYCIKDPKTPVWVKSLLTAALGYLIFPFDLLPDTIPIAGLVDDAAAIAYAIGVTADYITEEHYRKAANLLHNNAEKTEVKS